MQLSLNLKLAIDTVATGYKISDLQKISEELTKKYTNHRSNGNRLVTTLEEAIVYAIVRMPATYSAVFSALEHTLELIDCSDIKSMLDVGAGTGAASWAASELLELSTIDCVEREKQMISLGKKLMEQNSTHATINWILSDIVHFNPKQKYDMVIVSYSLNEMPLSQQKDILNKLWNYTNKLLLIIEPGTPYAFALQKNFREFLINQNAILVAPCPYNSECKIDSNDWCHFTCRVQRSKIHKQVKGAESPYEDEKFTYSAFIRTVPYQVCVQRIIRHPIIQEKKLSMQLCTNNGIELKSLYKKDGEIYKKAKKLGIGDALLTQTNMTTKGDN